MHQHKPENYVIQMNLINYKEYKTETERGGSGRHSLINFTHPLTGDLLS